MNNAKSRLAMSAATALVTLALPLSVMAANGPSRPTYTCGTGGICQGADHVVFDSFTNDPNYSVDGGNEEQFVSIRPAGSAGAFSTSLQVQAGQQYEVQVFVHNNADPGLITNPDNYNAQNTTFQATIPSTVNGSADITGAISASNATPGTVTSTATLNSSTPVNVSYDAGSAVWTNKGAANGDKLGDVTNGVLLGYNALDGVYPGCFNYIGYVTFNISVTAPSTPSTPSTPVTTTSVTPTVTPAALPDTGADEFAGLAGMAGTGAIGYGAMSYRRSKKALADKLRGRK
jgi:hypothetical protein